MRKCEALRVAGREHDEAAEPLAGLDMYASLPGKSQEMISLKS
jgi:hypothetical protein